MILKKYLIIVIFVLLKCAGYSSHIMGAYITYQFTGNANEYEIKLTKYWDCSGVPFFNIDSVCFSSVSCNYNFNITLTLQNGSPIEIDPCNAPPGTTTCQGGTHLGIKKYEYTAIVLLPFSCNDWRIDYSFHLQPSPFGSTYANVHSVINNLDYPQNSSPEINDNPCFFGCVPSPNCFLFNVTDTNNNSFYFKKTLIDTASGVSCPANITGQMASMNPIPFYDSLHIDSLSGMFCINYPVVGTYDYYTIMIAENLNGNSFPYIKAFFTYMIAANCVTSINENKNNNFLQLYPNPTTDFITIHYNLSSPNQTTLYLFNLYGQKLKTILNEKQPAGAHEIKIDMKDLEQGVYLVKMNVGGKEEARKVVKY